MNSILGRIDDIERRLRGLEAGGGTMLSGSDRTMQIRTNVKLATIRKTGIADNSATGIFSVTTTNESGSNDGGAYTCRVYTTVTHLATATSTNAAVEYNDSVFQKVSKSDGTSATALGEITEAPSSATAGATRDIGAVTPALNAASNYQTDFRLTIDLTGTDPQTAEATCFIVLIWSGYSTAPVIAAL